MNSIYKDFKDLFRFLIVYQTRKTKQFAIHFESFKNTSVAILMHRRGKFQKHVWHTAMIGFAVVGLLTSGVFGNNALVASTFPGMVDQDPRLIQTYDPNASGINLQNLLEMKTAVSSKPRSEIIEYEVKSGETISGIAEKFGISIDTVKWANDMDNVEAVKPGQKLKILPVSGVAYTVKSGDNIESVAKKYSAESQSILDFPFNDIPDDLKLKIAQVLIIPDGTPPESKIPARGKNQPQYIAKGPTSTFRAPGGGSFIWPTVYQYISTYFAWWHPGVDLPNRSAPGVVASDGGTVVVAGWPDNFGYGNRIMIDHGNGYTTLYAHLSNVYVSVGQTISRGQTIGQMGSTGRSTGTHLHFEIRYKGIAINPLAILK